MTWCVVKFLADSSVETVREQWIDKKTQTCKFPPRDYHINYAKLLKLNSPPEPNWRPYKVKILATCTNLDDARKKTKKAEIMSDLESAKEQLGRGHRPKKSTQKFRDRSSDEEDEAVSSESESGDSNVYPSDHMLLRKSLVAKKFQETSKNVQETPAATAVAAIGNTQPQMQSQAIINVQVDERNESGLESRPCSVLSKTSGNSGATETLDERKNFEQQVIRQLNLLTLKVDQIVENTNALLQKEVQKKNKPIAQKLDIMEVFPINDQESLNKLENWLEENGEHQHLLAVDLGRLGGSNVKELTRTLMYFCFTNSFGMKYTWEGIRGKNQFKTLRVVNVLFDAVRINNATATNSEIIGFIKSWLLRAKERETRKKTNKTATEPNNETL